MSGARLNTVARPWTGRLLLGLVITGLVGALAFGVWVRQPRSVEIHGPCRAFVAQAGRVTTPLLRGSEGSLELVISLTPASGDEPDAIYSAAKWHPTTLVVHPRLERIEVRGLTADGDLILPVSSRHRADEVLALLCFDQRHRSRLGQVAS